MEFNQEIAALEPSKSVMLMAKAREMQKTDSSILDLTAGDPDFPTPEPICEEAMRWLQKGYTHYTESQGNADLRRRIAEKLNTENHAPFQTENIIVTPGGKFAIYLMVRTLLNRGDEAIWLTPGWVSYPSIVQTAGGVPKAVHLRYEDQYRIREEALEAAVTDQTRLLLINYPNNPTGKILTPEDREVLHRFLTRHKDIYLLSDEMYEKVIFDGKEAVSMASDPDLFERTIVVNGFSKSAAMTGWRIGYAACSRELCRTAMKLFSHTMSCTAGFIQKAALKSMDLPEETERMRIQYERRRDILAEGFAQIPGVRFQVPDGAFYAWVRFDVEKTGSEFAEELLEQAGIVGIPGDAYGAEDGCYVRFAFAVSEDILRQMVVRLRDYMRLRQADSSSM